MAHWKERRKMAHWKERRKMTLWKKRRQVSKEEMKAHEDHKDLRYFERTLAFLTRVRSGTLGRF